MTVKWEKWLLTFWGMLAQSMGVAGSTWLGMGLKNGRIAWEDLWVALLTGAILPTVFGFLRTNPTPEIEEVTVTQTTTVTKTKDTDIPVVVPIPPQTPNPAADPPPVADETKKAEGSPRVRDF